MVSVNYKSCANLVNLGLLAMKIVCLYLTTHCSKHAILNSFFVKISYYLCKPLPSLLTNKRFTKLLIRVSSNVYCHLNYCVASVYIQTINKSKVSVYGENMLLCLLGINICHSWTVNELPRMNEWKENKLRFVLLFHIRYIFRLQKKALKI